MMKRKNYSVSYKIHFRNNHESIESKSFGWKR